MNVICPVFISDNVNKYIHNQGRELYPANRNRSVVIRFIFMLLLLYSLCSCSSFIESDTYRRAQAIAGNVHTNITSDFRSADETDYK